MFVLFGRNATIPPATRERLEQPLLDVGTDKQMLAALSDRVEAIKRANISVGDNLKIAQHRDTLRYAQKRSGGYAPMLRRFQVGDYVYVRAHPASRRNLDSHTHSVVRRVLRVGLSGTLKVQAPNGDVTMVHAENAAPCHVPSEQWTLSAEQMRQGHDTQACLGCNHTDREEVMLLCDACGQGWHSDCLFEPLTILPPDSEPWRCEECVRINRPIVPWNPKGPDKRSNAARRKQLAENPLDGRFVEVPFSDGKGKPTYFWGVVHYRGAA